MNNQEAKLILQAYRLGGQDAEDPQFREALAHAQRDPELARWYVEERAIETRIQQKIKSAAIVPTDLKNNLLALRKVVRPSPWWKRPAWFAAAAAVVLVASAAAFWLPSANAPQFTSLRETAMQMSHEKMRHLDFHSQDMAQIKDWLKSEHVDADFEVPASLNDLPVHGCKVIDWHGHKVTLLCFMPNGGHIDLFVVDCTRFRDFKPSERPQFARSDGLTTAVWCNAEKTYLLASTENEEQLRKIL